MPSGRKGDDTRSGLTHNYLLYLTATNNLRQISIFQPGTCYARPNYPQINARHFYKVRFEVPGIV